MINELKKVLRSYYSSISFNAAREKGLWPFNPLKKRMDDFDKAHPGLTPFQLKAAQYEIIAENFTPVLFPNDPFFFETGLKMAEYDGRAELSSGGWLFLRNELIMREMDPAEWDHYYAGHSLGLHLSYNIFDLDHHGFPYQNVLKQGLSGIYERVRAHQNEPDPCKKDFYEAAGRGLLAVKKIAERFAETARKAAEKEADPVTRKVYRRIAEAAVRVPWKPAGSFYEGLAAIWFLHEIGSVMDGYGMSIIGSPDSLLIDLYRADLASGAETEESASELLKIWLIHTDCKLDFSKTSSEQFNSGEQGDTMTIGGKVNELTFLLLKLHRESGLIYPKIHCRLSQSSPKEYIAEACKNFFCGRNTLDFMNDELVIPAQVAAGKDRNDAEDYVVGGCWEIMLEECEHSEGANCYFDLARAMDLSIQSTPEEETRINLHFIRPDSAVDFEELYSVFMNNIKMCLDQMMTLIRKFGVRWPEINPAPFYSVCMNGCIESGRDYSEGGAKYSPHALPLSDLATFVNSLLVIRTLCFERKKYTLAELLKAVRANWAGYENLRKEALSVPHIGDGSGEAALLLKRILKELADYVSGFKNERGGPFQCGIYSYVEIVNWAKYVRATPDGRFKGDFLAQGLSPTRLHADGLTDVLRDLSGLPLERFPADSVITISLPLNSLDPEKLIALLQTWVCLKSSGILQLNCVNREDLEDAVIHPERHQDLIVRLYGYSTRFVTLEKIKQQEFLSREFLKV